MINNLHMHASIQLGLVGSDIGATNDDSKYVDMTNFRTVDFIVQLGSTFEGTVTDWDAADTLDGFKLIQATDAAGTGSKDVTGATNVQTAVGTAGDRYVITLHTEALDGANDFTFVACNVSEAGNSGVDNVTVWVNRYNPRYLHEGLTSAKSHTVV